ncbi:Protein of unknown function [Bacillus mycoides]|uniref:Uncharacterized protein n=1 Tax=Bacillus mycoides TaxID=1405 RepID=A0A1G4EUJ6_BACMY|nr:Protein of unknown function [Bacillus mycoides]
MGCIVDGVRCVKMLFYEDKDSVS